MPKKPKTSSSFRRARAEMRDLHTQQEHRPMMADLYHRAEARQHRRRENHGPQLRAAKSGDGPERLLYELEVHQIELEMQNAELQKARNELETAVEKYTDLFDFAPVGYVSVDESGVILEANLTSATMLGLERSRLINRRLPLFISAASRPIFLSFLKKIFLGTKNHICEVPMLKENGDIIWTRLRATRAVSMKGERKWCRLAFGDITAGKKAEDALRASEGRFRTLFELGPVAIYSCDASGAIQDFNRRAVELWGRKPKLGESEKRLCGSFKLFRPDGSFMPHAQCPMAEVLNGKKSDVRDAEVVIERPDGSRITVIVNIRPLKHEHGKITGAINCFYDITDRKRAAEAQRRVEVLAGSNRKLEKEIIQRQAVQKALTISEQQARGLLEQSRQMHDQLRSLSRQVLLAQEEERKRISRELHDVIAQTLTSINLRLATLKVGAATDGEDLEENIARTQKLVEHSVEIVHRFARELRPTVLDDLGLIPALHTFMKGFKEETGIQVSLTAFAAVEKVSEDQRTVLYRVAQEALNNIARHSKASHAQVDIQKRNGTVCMKITDDGKGFLPAGKSPEKAGKRLGLLGMRERLEMVNGTFAIESVPGKGTTIVAEVPLINRSSRGGGWRSRADRSAKIKF